MLLTSLGDDNRVHYIKLNPTSLARKMPILLVLSLVDVSERGYGNIDLMSPCLKDLVFARLLVNPFLNREEKVAVFVLLLFKQI